MLVPRGQPFASFLLFIFPDTVVFSGVGCVTGRSGLQRPRPCIGVLLHFAEFFYNRFRFACRSLRLRGGPAVFSGSKSTKQPLTAFKCYFQKMLSPESPGGTTSQVSCEFSTFHPPKVWYPPPAGDRPPKDTLRVVTITNTGLLQRQVKQKKLRMLAMPAMARNLSLCPNAGPKQIRLVSSLLRFL